MNNYLRTVKYARPYLKRFVLGLISMYILIIAEKSWIFVFKYYADQVFPDQVNHEHKLYYIGLLPFIIVALFVIRGIFSYITTYLMEYVGQKMVFDLRNELFDRMIGRRGLAYFEHNRVGSLMSYYNTDINMLRTTVTDAGVDIVKESSVLLISIGLMFYFSWQLTLITLISAPLVAVAARKIGRKVKKASRYLLEQLQEFSAMLQEVLSGVRQIKSFAREEFEQNRFRKQTHKNFRAAMKTTQTKAVLSPIVEFMATAGVALVVWYGCLMVANGQMTFGSLGGFLALAIGLSSPIKRISKCYGKIQEFDVAAGRIYGIMDAEPEVKDRPDAVNMPSIEGRVVFDRVTFAYGPDDAPAIKDFSYEVKAGRMVALVGPSGSGKSTLCNLLMRFYDVSSGAVSIDGLDVRAVTQKSLREHIGIVPQDIFLFSGTIYDNILYGRLDATEEEVKAAAEAAYVTEFVERLPGGFQTLVGERGLALSGGQRQRVAIARAVLKNPGLLILDEATSALDTDSEQMVQEALDRLLKNRTSFVVAHRLSTIYKADTILVLDQGRLAEHGTHQELLALDGLYARLYQTQFRRDREI